LEVKITLATVINVHDAKTHISKLLERAHAGQEIILAKAGKPDARLMPLAPGGQPAPAATLKNRWLAGTMRSAIF